MHKANGILTIVAGLVLLFQAGATLAYADDGQATGAKVQIALETVIGNAENAAAKLAEQIAAAKRLLVSGNLSITGQLALGATINAALGAQAELAMQLAAAQNLLAALTIGTNAQNAQAPHAAEQAAGNLNAAINAAGQANANIGNTTGAIGATSATTAAVVGGVQTTPTTTSTTQGTHTGARSATASRMVIGGLQTLPSTSTESNVTLILLGGVLVSVGIWLLRRPEHHVG